MYPTKEEREDRTAIVHKIMNCVLKEKDEIEQRLAELNKELTVLKLLNELDI